MYIFGGMGFLHWLLSVLSLLVMLAGGVFTGNWHTDSVLPVIAIVFGIGSAQFVLLGLIIEMLMRTYYESQGKGPYAIQRVINGYKHVPLPVSEPRQEAAVSGPPPPNTDQEGR